MPDPFHLRGRTAIVTGGTRGIGRATAEALARAGAHVIITGRKPEACEEAAEQMRAAGLTVSAIAGHAGRKADLEQLVARTLDRHGGLDILVCNAATNPVHGSLAALPDTALDKILDTNLRGPLWLCNLALPHMAGRPGSSAILLSSIASVRGTTALGAYSISKAAVNALVRNLAVEWGPRGVRVNALVAGLVKTDFSRALWEDPERVEKAASRTPLRRIGTPEDIAGVALFLASEASAYVTGQCIVADGGETIAP